MMSLTQVKAFIQEMESHPLNEEDEDFQTAVVFWYGSVNGIHNATILSDATGYPKQFVIPIISRLYEGGIWHNGQLCMEWDENKDDALQFIIEFWLCVGCAQGVYDRVMQEILPAYHYPKAKIM